MSGDVWLHWDSVGRSLLLEGDGVARNGQRKDQNGERAHVAKHHPTFLGDLSRTGPFSSAGSQKRKQNLDKEGNRGLPK